MQETFVTQLITREGLNTHTVHTVHESAGKHAQRGGKRPQLPSINQLINIIEKYYQRSIHSSIRHRDAPVHSSFCSTVRLLFLHSSHLYYLIFSYTHITGQTEAHSSSEYCWRSGARPLPSHCAKSCRCKQMRPLGVAVSLRHRHY